MMKFDTVIPYLKKIQQIYESWHIPCVLLTSAFFHRKSATFIISINTDIDGILYRTYNSLNFFWVFNAFLINAGAILMVSAKLATLCLLKIRVFWKKVDVIIFGHDVTNNILSCNSYYIVDVIFWLKFGNSSISLERGYYDIDFIKILPEKPIFLRGGLGSSSMIWDWH